MRGGGWLSGEFIGRMPFGVRLRSRGNDSVNWSQELIGHSGMLLVMREWERHFGGFPRVGPKWTFHMSFDEFVNQTDSCICYNNGRCAMTALKQAAQSLYNHRSQIKTLSSYFDTIYHTCFKKSQSNNTDTKTGFIHIQKLSYSPSARG